MQISALILGQMVKYFIMMLMGYGLVRSKAAKVDSSRTLSLLSIYLVTPCAIINAFQIEYTPETMRGLLLALCSAILIQAVFWLFTTFGGRIFHWNVVERASIMYSNAGNMIIPVVLSVLGEEWVLYSSAYITVQLLLQWTHARGMMSGEHSFDWRKILCNVNILSILTGMILFALRIRLPSVLRDTCSTVGALMGPLGMFTMGMLMANNDLKKCFLNARIYSIALMRLCVCPLIVLTIMRLTGAWRLLPDGATILFISFLACTTPPSVTTTQLALFYGQDAGYSSALNIASTTLCLATIPLLTLLYWHWIG